MRRSRRIVFLLAWIVTVLAHPGGDSDQSFRTMRCLCTPRLRWSRLSRCDRKHSPRIRVKRHRLGASSRRFKLTLLLGLSWITEAPQLTLLAAIFAIFAAAAALTVIAAWRSYRTLALFGMLLSGAVFYGAGYRIALPALEPFWISEKRFRSGTCARRLRRRACWLCRPQ